MSLYAANGRLRMGVWLDLMSKELCLPPDAVDSAKSDQAPNASFIAANFPDSFLLPT
jgi:hypothetical protein